jgi:hypothetical protein
MTISDEAIIEAVRRLQTEQGSVLLQDLANRLGSSVEEVRAQADALTGAGRLLRDPRDFAQTSGADLPSYRVA